MAKVTFTYRHHDGDGGSERVQVMVEMPDAEVFDATGWVDKEHLRSVGERTAEERGLFIYKDEGETRIHYEIW